MTQFVSSKRSPSSWNKPDIPTSKSSSHKAETQEVFGGPKKNLLFGNYRLSISQYPSFFFDKKRPCNIFCWRKRKRAKNATNGYMSVGRKFKFPKRTSSSWGVPYPLSLFGNPSYLCIVGNSKILSNWPVNSNGCVKQSFCCERGGRRRGAVCVIILIVCGDLVG